MCLNPAKCFFKVQEDKFLGFILTKRGIEASPDKYHEVIDMRSPTNVKEVQQITGRLVALSCFLSCMGAKAFCFFVALRNKEKFQWTAECGEAFSKVK